MKAPARLVALATGILLLLAGCGGASSPSGGAVKSTGSATKAATSTGGSTQGAGSTLTIGISEDLESLDPLLSGAYVDRHVLYAIYDSLVAVTPQGKIVPDLATSWHISKDGLTYTFQLQPDVKFQDGTPFNAKAMVFDFERAIKDKSSPEHADAKFIATVKATGPLQLQIKLKKPFAPFLSLLIDRFGMAVSPAAVKKYGSNYAQHPVGTGAFMLKNYVKGDHVTLVKNPHYWKAGEPKVDTVVFKILPDSNAALLDLKAGTIDVLDGAPPQDLPSLKKDSSVVVSVAPGMAFRGFGFNVTAAPFNNVWLRRAVAAAIDRATLVHTVFGGAAAPGDTAFPPSSWAYTAHSVPGADLSAAKSDLAKGHQPNGFSFTYTTITSPTDQKIAQVLQNMLQQVGIKMKIKLIDSGSFTAIVEHKNYQALGYGWSGRPDPDQNAYNWYHTNGAFNFGGYSSSKMDSLLDQARVLQSQAKRKQLYNQVAKLANTDVPYVVLYWPKDIKLLLPKVTGFTHYPDGVFRVDPMGLK